MHMLDDVLHGTAHFPPSYERHDAVRAHLVAAAHDRNVCAQPVGCRQWLRTVEIRTMQRLDLREKAVRFADVEDIVEIRKALEQCLAVLDRHAPRNGNGPTGPLALPRNQLAKLAEHFLLGIGSHRARDEDRDVSFIERDLRNAPDVGQLLSQLLAVCVVHLTTDVPEMHTRWPAQHRHDRLPARRASRER
jgi:hypothetical protein